MLRIKRLIGTGLMDIPTRTVVITISLLPLRACLRVWRRSTVAVLARRQECTRAATGGF
jgi:hypothetical protein